MLNYKLIAQLYFQRFADKNIDGLAVMFDDNITLRDWTTNRAGKQSVLDFNRELFGSVRDIKITPQRVLAENNIVMAQILVELTQHDGAVVTLKVVDVLEFSGDNIVSIQAYMG